MLLQFGKEVGMDSAIHAEVLALREELLVASASIWASTHSFVFEFDSMFVVD